ncbi:hypothetical protein MmiAt1_14660 [Methanimicrococcus sp. At1]|uniref:Replication factor A n=1 Tax=Methanimicrococcus hacksteinii TaxID=3028293 RepID=A0ABU3VRU1_9EURY|nr:replication protein A [Methanimicrococcus sp. At1]MDV0445866.1 hypothetical protein [Methanimicrococcus sp. At1]
MTDMNETGLADSAESIQFNETKINASNDLTDRVMTIQKMLTENGADVPAAEIEEKLKNLTEIFKVPAAEAQRSVTNAYLKKFNIAKPKVFAGKGTAVTKKVADISAMAGLPDTWVNLTGKVIQVWENSHESIAQAGLVGDETGIVKFTIWNGSEIEPLELNKTYDFKNVIVKSWNGKAGISLNKAAVVTGSEEEITVVKSGDYAAGEMKERVNEMRTVSELSQNGLWTDLKANVVQIFEKTHESIAFAGILGDETGTMRFTVWKTSEVEQLEAEKSYLFKNVLVKEWNGSFFIEVNRAGKIEEIDEEIIAKPSVFEVCGCAVDIQAGSGLIRRCPECSKVMAKGMCSEHGRLKGKYDLRIKAVFDDGTQAHETIINCELTEKLLGMSLEDAVLTATETLDPECINDIIKNEFIGKYYTVSGAKTDRYIIAENVERAESADLSKAVWLKSLIAEELSQSSQPGRSEEEESNADSTEMEKIENFSAEELNDISELAETQEFETPSNSDFEKFEKMLNSMDSDAGNADDTTDESEDEIEEIKVI